MFTLDHLKWGVGWSVSFHQKWGVNFWFDVGICGKCNSIILNILNINTLYRVCVCARAISGHVGSVWILKGRISCELFGPTMNHNTLWTVGSDWHMAQGWNAILKVTESWARIRPQNVWIWLCLKIGFTKNLIIVHIVSYFFEMILGGIRVLGLLKHFDPLRQLIARTWVTRAKNDRKV